MATKAELEAELASLKEKLAEANARAESGAAARDDETENDQSSKKPADENDQRSAEDALAEIWDQLQEELGDLPSKKPWLTVGAAFVLGLLIGRSTR